MRARLLTLVLLVTAASAVRAEPEASKSSALDRSIERGVAYLVKSQNENGSWGSPASNLHDIYAPPPGSQQAFQVASSALALSALVEVGGDGKEVGAAVERATAWLLKKHAVRRVSPNTLYNTWAHAYALEAFARLLEREKDPEQRKRLTKACRKAIQRLETFETVEGGWGYYDFQVRAKTPGPGATSFTTATVLIAMKMAQAQGVEVPERLVKRGLPVIHRSSRPDGAYSYSMRTRWAPQMGVNKTKGSLARTPACLLAVDMWDDDVETKKFCQALDELETYGHFLRIARKYPIPHETWYQNSGYFCFYGYYYATWLFPRVPEKKVDAYRKQIAGHLTKMQEKDGSWWDYQLFNFHKAYGTGYILIALGRCRPGTP